VTLWLVIFLLRLQLDIKIFLVLFCEKEQIMAKVKMNQLAPDFELLDTQNNLVRLSQFKSTYNVILVLNRGFL
jgi:hypothetical protein